MRTLTAALLLLSAACTPAPTPPAAPTLDALADARWIDLSHAYDADTIFWPTGKPYDHIETAYGPAEGGYFYSSYDLFSSEHAGTHIDAPIHFAAGRRTVDEIPLEDLAGPARVIDVSAASSADPDYLVTAEDLTAYEAEHGPVGKGDIVLFRTDWSKRWPDTKSYMGDDTVGVADNLHFPGIGPDAARLLVERGVEAVGIDTASIDNGPSADFMTHQILLDAEIPGLENLANLAELPATGAWIIAMPMKIGRGSGGPCRVAALLPPRS